jgi:hypothetical protein
MSDAVAAAPLSHAKSARDKEAKLEKEREERERERQKAAAAAVKAQLAAQGNSRLAVETAYAEEEKKTVAPARTGSNAKGVEAAAAPPPPPPPVQPPPPPPPARVTSPRAAAAAPAGEPPSPAPPSLSAALSGQEGSVPGTPVRAALGAAAPLGTPPPPPRPGVPQSPQFNSSDACELRDGLTARQRCAVLCCAVVALAP